jgi:hypothetical protein
MPSPAMPHLLLDEVGGATGYALWRVLSDATLWVECPNVESLFWRQLPATRIDNPDLLNPVTALGTVVTETRPVLRGALAEAAGQIWD